MGFSDSWHRTLVYFGLAEDRDAYPDTDEEEHSWSSPAGESLTGGRA